MKLKYSPKAVVFHRHSQTAWAFFKQQWKYGRGYAQLYIKYRQEISWNWRKSVSAYRDLARSAWILAKSGLHIHHWSQDKEEIYFYYFEFLKSWLRDLALFEKASQEATYIFKRKAKLREPDVRRSSTDR